MLSKSVLRYGLYGLSLFTMAGVAVVDSATRLDGVTSPGASGSGSYPVRMEMPPARPGGFDDVWKAAAAKGAGYPLRIELSSVPLVEPGFSLTGSTRIAVPAALSVPLPGPKPTVAVGSANIASPVALPPAPAIAAVAAAMPSAGRNRLVPIHFDLADPYEQSGGGSEIEVRKVVRIDGSDAGTADIRVNANSTLSISRDTLTTLLAHAGRGDLATKLGNARGQDGKYVSFSEMRDQGIDVHYDPSTDRISVSK